MSDSPNHIDRRHGRRGLIPPDLSIPHPLLADFLLPGVSVPDAPAEFDVSGGIVDWGMLGNDEYGDCGPCSEFHGRMAKAAAGGTPEDFTTAAVTANYFAYTGGKDTGVDLGPYLKWLFDEGDILGYVAVTEAEAAAMAYAGHGVIVGVALTDDAEQLFEAHKAWTTAQGQRPDNNEGHAILYVARTASGSGYVTWGALQASTAGWDAACVQQRFAFMTKEDELIDYAALAAYIQEMGGTEVPGQPTPAPTPGPAPAPAPAPSPAPSPSPTPGTTEVPITLNLSVAEIDRLKELAQREGHETIDAYVQHLVIQHTH